MGMIRRIPLAEWLPDLGGHNNDGLYKVKGVVSTGGRYLPNPIFNGVTLTGNGGANYGPFACFGMHLHTSLTSPKSKMFFVGVYNDILRSTGTDTLATQRATAAGTANTPDVISGWQFTSFGNAVYACCFNGTTGHFLSATTPTTNFATFVAATAPVTYSPIPRYVSTIKNHLLIANVGMQTTLGEFTANTVYPNLVMWSATDNPARWGDELTANYPETVGSSYQHLYDEFGPITALCGGADAAYIFKPRAIYRMEGPEWSFHPVVTGAGTIYPNSVARFYNDIYFWGPCGPARLRYGSSEVENIGLGKVQRAVTEFQNSEFFEYCFEVGSFENSSFEVIFGETYPIDISTAVDYRAGLIAFFFGEPTVDGSLSTTLIRRSGCLIYDVNTESFSFFSVPTKARFAKSVPMYGANPPSIGGTDSSQHSVLDGVYCVLLNDSMTSTTAAQLAAARGDSEPLDTIAVAGDPAYLYDWAPEFTTPFNPLAVDDQNGPITTSVRRVRVPFVIRRFDESAASGPSSAVEAWETVVEVTVRSKNRYLGEYEEVTGSYTTGDSWQSADMWIDLGGGKGSSEALYHQFVIRIHTRNPDDSEVNGAIVNLRDLTYFEVEYDVGSGPTGSTYMA